jgi:hypothetical protein
MRTTVDIADDLLAEAKVLAARTHRSLSAVVDDALRAMLRRDDQTTISASWTFPTGGAGGLRPGVNLDDREALAELLGDNALP